MVGVGFRAGASKLVSADTGKFRLTFAGADVIVPRDPQIAVLSSRAGKARLGIHSILGGRAHTFEVESNGVHHAAFNDEMVVFAGSGLHAFSLEGQRLWTFAPETHFSEVISTLDGFNAIAYSDKGTTVLSIDCAGVPRER
jgi:hypothetical protein